MSMSNKLKLVCDIIIQLIYKYTCTSFVDAWIHRAQFSRPLFIIENPYALLACTCHEKTPGRTAIVLGPMW